MKTLEPLGAAIERDILAAIPSEGGLTTRRIADKLKQKFGHNQHTHSGLVLSYLRAMERGGQITRLDKEKPIVWTRV